MRELRRHIVDINKIIFNNTVENLINNKLHVRPIATNVWAILGTVIEHTVDRFFGHWLVCPFLIVLLNGGSTRCRSCGASAPAAATSPRWCCTGPLRTRLLCNVISDG